MSVKIASRFSSVQHLHETRFKLKVLPNGDRILVPIREVEVIDVEARKKYVWNLLVSGSKLVPGEVPSDLRVSKRYKPRNTSSEDWERGTFADLVKHQQENRMKMCQAKKLA